MNKILKLLVVSIATFTIIAAPAEAAMIGIGGSNKDDMAGTWSLDQVSNSFSQINISAPKFQTIQNNYLIGLGTPSASKKTASGAKTKTIIVTATGYSSTPDQTDDSPFITASGTYVRDGIIAANFLPLGSAIKIPELFGNKIFIVEDRMNSRYWYNIDVWFANRDIAKTFGIKKVTIEIVS